MLPSTDRTRTGCLAGRAGFTLIELLVVTGLVLVLMGLALVLVPTINNEQKATQAGTQLQQWIEIAKQRAGRDRVPRGIRLMPGAANSLQVTQLQYLEQPPDYWLGSGSSFFTPGTSYNLSPPGQPPVLGWVVIFSLTPSAVPPGTVVPDFAAHLGKPANFFPKNGAGGKDPNAGRYPVQPGDRLVMGLHNEVHTIVAVSDLLELTLATQPSTFPLVSTPPVFTVKAVQVVKQVATITTAGPTSNIAVGQSVVIAGLKKVPQLNGTWTTTSVSPTSYTFNVPFNIADTTVVDSATTSPLFATTPYRIMRQPRPIGDDPLQMPVNIIIDAQPRGLGYDLPTQTVNGQPVLTTPIDIMFAPDGRVIGPMAAYDKIILWVRDVTVLGAPGDPAAQGDPSLVCIYPRTGLVQGHRVDVSFVNSNPYTFTTTGRRSSQ
jgi:prepilin-type N-terminal cleavage/methylation domain-containing protein